VAELKKIENELSAQLTTDEGMDSKLLQSDLQIYKKEL
jgi:hypothetical protein